ncbi:Peptidyl-dipeptidase dcp [compost metagenome]
MSRHYSKIGTNAALFARIDALWEKRVELGLTLEQERVLERHWKGFVKSGAKLDKPEQDRLSSIGEKLAGLGAQFGQNVLGDEKEWSLKLTDEAELEGLPDFLRDAMAAAARDRAGPRMSGTAR